MFTRRAFLIGAGTALTLPVLNKFEWFLEAHDRPLIEAPSNPLDVLYVYPDEDYEIHLGLPVEEPPSITWRHFITEFRGLPVPTKLSEFRDLEEEWGMPPTDLDCECPQYRWIDDWARRESSNANAHYLLQRLEIGPELRGGPNEVGGITFIDAPGICNDYLGVRADNELSVSLLQHRLNELGQQIAVELVAG